MGPYPPIRLPRKVVKRTCQHTLPTRKTNPHKAVKRAISVYLRTGKRAISVYIRTGKRDIRAYLRTVKRTTRVQRARLSFPL